MIHRFIRGKAASTRLEIHRDGPLRILLVMHTAWTRDLGAPRVNVELAEEWTKNGHTVDKFDLEDAGLSGPGVLRSFDLARFSQKATEHVRRYGRDYDIIQAEQGNLHCRRESLRYNGLLVARSNGLIPLFEACPQVQQELSGGTLPGRIVRWLARRSWGVREVAHSFATADAIVVINQDEVRYVGTALGLQSKCILVPNGLSKATFKAFAENDLPVESRLSQSEIAFVGHWGPRKGSLDMPEIVRRVRTQKPDASFALLGTGGNECSVIAGFDERDQGALRIVTRYSPSELPRLLGGCAAAMFPSYIEGFPYSVLETLAAGLPTVGYDVPGTREILGREQAKFLVAPADIQAMADRLCAILTLSVDEYAALAVCARAIGTSYRLENVAGYLAEEYARRLAGRFGLQTPEVKFSGQSSKIK